MTGAGSFGTPSSPLSKLFTERVVLDERTTDPSSPEQGEIWFRSDLDSGTDKFGEVRWYDGLSTKSVPVFDKGSSGSSVEEVVGIGTKNGTAYIPMAPRADATYQQLSVQHGGSVLGAHDAASVNQIPDSVVTQFNPETFTAGDATWSDDVRTNDMALTGDLQEGTLSNGDASVVGDGTDDYGLYSMPAELSGSSLNSWAIEVELEWSFDGAAAYSAINDGTNQLLALKVNQDESFSGNPGQVFLQFQDDSGVGIRARPSANPGLNDGTRHVVVMNMIDASTGDFEMIIDGTKPSLTFDRQGNCTSFIDWTLDMAAFAGSAAGSIGNYYGSDIGVIRLHGSSISSQTL